MYRPRIGILFILVCMATSITFAGSYFTNNNSPAPALPKQPPNPAMAPGDFSNLSQQQQQQTQSNMSQQVTKNMAASPYPVPGAPPAPAQQQQQPQQQQQTDNSGNDNSGASTQDPSQSPQPYSGTAAPSSTGNRSNGGSSQQGLGIKY